MVSNRWTCLGTASQITLHLLTYLHSFHSSSRLHSEFWNRPRNWRDWMGSTLCSFRVVFGVSFNSRPPIIDSVAGSVYPGVWFWQGAAICDLSFLASLTKHCKYHFFRGWARNHAHVIAKAFAKIEISNIQNPKVGAAQKKNGYTNKWFRNTEARFPLGPWGRWFWIFFLSFFLSFFGIDEPTQPEGKENLGGQAITFLPQVDGTTTLCMLRRMAFSFNTGSALWVSKRPLKFCNWKGARGKGTTGSFGSVFGAALEILGRPREVLEAIGFGAWALTTTKTTYNNKYKLQIINTKHNGRVPGSISGSKHNSSVWLTFCIWCQETSIVNTCVFCL